MNKTASNCTKEDYVGLLMYESCYSVSSRDSSDWLVDSGATSHMSGNSEYFSDKKYLTDLEKVTSGDGRTLDVICKGTVIFTPSGTHSRKLV